MSSTKVFTHGLQDIIHKSTVLNGFEDMNPGGPLLTTLVSPTTRMIDHPYLPKGGRGGPSFPDRAIPRNKGRNDTRFSTTV